MVTAEFAVTLLALVVVLAALLSGIQWAAHQARAQEAARAAARQLARGDAAAEVSARVQQSLPGADVGFHDDGSSVTVSLAAPLRLAMGVSVTVRADAHTLAEHR